MILAKQNECKVLLLKAWERGISSNLDPPQDPMTLISDLCSFLPSLDGPVANIQHHTT